MTRKTLWQVIVSLIVAVTLLTSCGGGKNKQATPAPPSARPTASATPSPTAEKPFAQEVPLVIEGGTKRYVITDRLGFLACDPKSTISRPLSTRGATSLDGSIVDVRTYKAVKDGEDKFTPMMDIIYPRTIPIKAVIVNKRSMGVVRIPKRDNYFANIRLMIDVPTFVSFGSIRDLTACVAKPPSKKKKGK